MLLGDLTARKKGSLSFYFGRCHKWSVSYWNRGSYLSIRGKLHCWIDQTWTCPPLDIRELCWEGQKYKYGNRKVKTNYLVSFNVLWFIVQKQAPIKSEPSPGARAATSSLCRRRGRAAVSPGRRACALAAPTRGHIRDPAAPTPPAVLWRQRGKYQPSTARLPSPCRPSSRLDGWRIVGRQCLWWVSELQQTRGQEGGGHPAHAESVWQVAETGRRPDPAWSESQMIFPGLRHRREECDHHGHRHPVEEDLQVAHLDEFSRVVVIRRATIGG